MNRQTMAMASILMVLLMGAVGLAVGSTLPPDVQLPVHWGVSGEADGFAGKWWALLAPAGIAALVSLLFYFLPAIEPRREGFERSQDLYLWGWVALLLIAAVVQVAVVSAALGWDIAGSRLIVGGVGILFVLIGNPLGKTRSTYTMGVRTPWTLASEEVWVRTHRLAGKLMVGAGLVIFAAAVAGLAPERLAAVTIGGVLVGSLVPVLWSYLLWRRERRGDQPSR